MFFHPTCAPKVKLTEKMQQEIAASWADAIGDDVQRNPEKYASRDPIGAALARGAGPVRLTRRLVRFTGSSA